MSTSINKPLRHSRRNLHGFTMIEILISLFILAVGILGASALQLVSFNANSSAMYRTQAIFLANDIIDRMRIDPVTARGLAFNGIDTATVATAGTSCATSSGCPKSGVADQGIIEWADYFRGTSPLLPNGQGTITRISGNIFRITISWNENDKLTQTSTTNSYIVDVQI
jgi:type IV pilus assembly protein PilV